MNGLEAGEYVRTRLADLIPSRTVYLNGVPDGPLPTRYIVVWTSEGSEEHTRATGTVNVQTPSIWVTSVSRNGDAEKAAHEAGWGASRLRAALRNYRPESRWALRAVASSPPRRDETLPETTYSAVEQFTVRSAVRPTPTIPNP